MPSITIDLTDEEAAQLAELAGRENDGDTAATARILFVAGLRLKLQWQLALDEQERDERILGPEEPAGMGGG